MIKIKQFVCNMLQENCYVASDETNECVIIDCGAFYTEERNAIISYINDNDLHPVHLLSTHGHLDHNFGNNTIYDKFGLSPKLSEADNQLLQLAPTQANEFYGMNLDYILPTPSSFLKENENIVFGNEMLVVLDTPGHSMGSITFYNEKNNLAFTGDTLFRHSIGRTDFAGGSMLQIIQSLRKLAQLPDNTVILPGHGNTTTIGEELNHNPYMDR